jgi:hypothetical protein
VGVTVAVGLSVMVGVWPGVKVAVGARLGIIIKVGGGDSSDSLQAASSSVSAKNGSHHAGKIRKIRPPNMTISASTS